MCEVCVKYLANFYAGAFSEFTIRLNGFPVSWTFISPVIA